jgi:hypothetical protein
MADRLPSLADVTDEHSLGPRDGRRLGVGISGVNYVAD